MPLLTEVFVIKEAGEQPNAAVEKLLSSGAVNSFTSADWLALGIAALDQAGLPASATAAIEKMAQKSMPMDPGTGI